MKKTNKQWGGHNRKPLSWHYDGGCIRCTSHKVNSDGYTQIHRFGYSTLPRIILSKRFKDGKIPAHLESRHTCDNRWCVNPSHIVQGTTQDNTADRVARGRTAHNFGSKQGTSKLSEKTVLRIRKFASDGMTQFRIANLFGIHQTNVHYIVSRKTWPHI